LTQNWAIPVRRHRFVASMASVLRDGEANELPSNARAKPRVGDGAIIGHHGVGRARHFGQCRRRADRSASRCVAEDLRHTRHGAWAGLADRTDRRRGAVLRKNRAREGLVLARLERLDCPRRRRARRTVARSESGTDSELIASRRSRLGKPTRSSQNRANLARQHRLVASISCVFRHGEINEPRSPE
jgi:hypothetical protein